MRSKADLAMRDAEQRTPLDEALEARKPGGLEPGGLKVGWFSILVGWFKGLVPSIG